MSDTCAPSFWACFTLEFINTVQRVPRSTGCRAKRASFAKSFAVKPRELAKFSINEPQPEEQASLSSTFSTTPPFSLMHFMS